MKSLLVLLFLFGALCSVCYVIDKRNEEKQSKRILKVLQIAEEWGYFQGQKEAIEGDVRIARIEGVVKNTLEEGTKTNFYRWSKSPWNDKPLSAVLYRADEPVEETWKRILNENTSGIR